MHFTYCVTVPFPYHNHLFFGLVSVRFSCDEYQTTMWDLIVDAYTLIPGTRMSFKVV